MTIFNKTNKDSPTIDAEIDCVKKKCQQFLVKIDCSFVFVSVYDDLENISILKIYPPKRLYLKYSINIKNYIIHGIFYFFLNIYPPIFKFLADLLYSYSNPS